MYVVCLQVERGGVGVQGAGACTDSTLHTYIQMYVQTCPIKSNYISKYFVILNILNITTYLNLTMYISACTYSACMYSCMYVL